MFKAHCLVPSSHGAFHTIVQWDLGVCCPETCLKFTPQLLFSIVWSDRLSPPPPGKPSVFMSRFHDWVDSLYFLRMVPKAQMDLVPLGPLFSQVPLQGLGKMWFCFWFFFLVIKGRKHYARAGARRAADSRVAVECHRGRGGRWAGWSEPKMSCRRGNLRQITAPWALLSSSVPPRLRVRWELGAHSVALTTSCCVYPLQLGLFCPYLRCLP